jgi:hypothetical protein
MQGVYYSNSLLLQSLFLVIGVSVGQNNKRFHKRPPISEAIHQLKGFRRYFIKREREDQFSIRHITTYNYAIAALELIRELGWESTLITRMNNKEKQKEEEIGNYDEKYDNIYTDL